MKKIKCRKYNASYIWVTHIVLMLLVNLACVTPEDLTGSPARAEMLLTKQQLG